MIIAELSGRCRQSPIVLGGEGQSLGIKDALTIGPFNRHSLKPCFHKSSQIYINSKCFPLYIYTCELQAVFRPQVALCKGIRIPGSRKLLLVQSESLALES